MSPRISYCIVFSLLLLVACTPTTVRHTDGLDLDDPGNVHVRLHLQDYAYVSYADDTLTESEAKLVDHLIKAADLIDDLYWYQAYGSKAVLLSSITDEPSRKMAEIHFGPWDRHQDYFPFIQSAGVRPAGANYYPYGMSREELLNDPVRDKESPYTLIRRNTEDELQAIYYHDAFALQIRAITAELRMAAGLAADEAFRTYLLETINALQTDEYWPGEELWMELQDNPIDLFIGPSSSVDDKLFYNKQAYAATVLKRCGKGQTYYQDYQGELLKRIQAFSKEFGLPLIEQFEIIPVSVYRQLYTAGYARLPQRTFIGLLPIDERVELEKGQRLLCYQNLAEQVTDSLIIPMALQTVQEWKLIRPVCLQKIHVLRHQIMPRQDFELYEELLDLGLVEKPKSTGGKDYYQKLFAYYVVYRLLYEESGYSDQEFATSLLTELLYSRSLSTSSETEDALLAMAMDIGFVKFEEQVGFSLQPAQLDNYLNSLQLRLQLGLTQRDTLPTEYLKPAQLAAPVREFLEDKQRSLSPKYLVSKPQP